MTHRTPEGSPRHTRGYAQVFQPTPKMWALAFPASERIPAVCPGCGAAIAFAGIWMDAGTDTRHDCKAAA